MVIPRLSAQKCIRDFYLCLIINGPVKRPNSVLLCNARFARTTLDLLLLAKHLLWQTFLRYEKTEMDKSLISGPECREAYGGSGRFPVGSVATVGPLRTAQTSSR